MSTFTNKQLAKGSITTSLSTVYTVPANTKTIISSVYFVVLNNSQNFSMAINGLYYHQQNSSLNYSQMNLQELPQMVLNTGDTIQLSASTNNVFNFIISGIEIT